MSDITWLHILVMIAAAIGTIYAVKVRNRFKVLEHNIRAASARVGATIHYARSIDRHANYQSRQGQQHAGQMANKGVRRGPRGKWQPAFFADFNPWPDARGVEVIIPAMQAGLGGRGQEHQARLALIEAIRTYNQELDQIPGGTIAEHFWQFRHFSYRTEGGPSGGRRHRSGLPKGGRRGRRRGGRRHRRP